MRYRGEAGGEGRVHEKVKGLTAVGSLTVTGRSSVALKKSAQKVKHELGGRRRQGGVMCPDHSRRPKSAAFQVMGDIVRGCA